MTGPEFGADHRLQPWLLTSRWRRSTPGRWRQGASKIDIVMREHTQGDPTKAVNAPQELISQAKVHAIWGPAQFRRGG